MILGCVPFRAIYLYHEGDCTWCTKWEDTVLSVAVPASWFFLMFFAGYTIFQFSIEYHLYF
jgi:hypothetical protein